MSSPRQLVTGLEVDNLNGIKNMSNSDASIQDENMELSLKDFKMLKILKEYNSLKKLVVEGHFKDNEDKAIIILDKMNFDEHILSEILNDSRLELIFQNNIYGSYYLFSKNNVNGIEMQIIYPAKKNDYESFIEQQLIMVKESPEMHLSLVWPYFKEMSQAQAYKEDYILNDKETIIYKDCDPELGFMLINEIEKSESKLDGFIDAVAICYAKNLLSLRDLTDRELPFLIKLQDKCLEELSTKFKISPSKLEGYVVYPPRRYPFHVYFQNVDAKFSKPVEKVCYLTTIISNLQLVSDYYQKVNLNYVLPESDPLLIKFLDAGFFTK